MKTILIIQNDAHEGAGQMASAISRHGYESNYVMGTAAEHAALLHERFSGLIVLGGAQGAYETDKYPYLEDQMHVCRDFIEADKPIAGFCLGAQLLACAVGGKVLPNERKEIGWYDITLTDAAADDPLMRDHPQTLLAYHFHGDYIQDVPGGVNLASSKMTGCQLFRYGSTAYGFQYHVEADQPLVEVMCRNNRGYMSTNGFESQAVIDQSKIHMPTFEWHSGKVLDRWLDLVSTS
jgi:GMP synthase (glutamine-hydrolysing)